MYNPKLLRFLYPARPDDPKLIESQRDLAANFVVRARLVAQQLREANIEPDIELRSQNEQNRGQGEAGFAQAWCLAVRDTENPKHREDPRVKKVRLLGIEATGKAFSCMVISPLGTFTTWGPGLVTRARGAVMLASPDDDVPGITSDDLPYRYLEPFTENTSQDRIENLRDFLLKDVFEALEVRITTPGIQGSGDV